MYFDVSRKAVVGYAIKGDPLFMQWAYKKAVTLNPLEKYTYARILNKTYLEILRAEIKRQQG